MAKLMMGTEEVLKVMMGTEEITSLFMGSEDVSPSSGSPEPQPVDYSTMPFTIEALGSGDFKFKFSGVDYSTDGGDTWNTTTSAMTALNLSEGDAVQFKKTSPTSIKEMFTGNTAITFNVYGNIMSLIYGDNFVGQTSLPSVTDFFKDFFNSSNVVDASNLILPATTLISNCYQQMFYGCASLTSAPELPATTLATYCYFAMFRGCTSLTTAPELPAEKLRNNCYQQMFYGCSNLQYIKCMATSISASSCLNWWVRNISSTGTFVKDANTTWPSGNDGIPNNWTIVDA